MLTGVALAAVLLCSPLAAQELPWMLVVHGNVTTSSQIFPFINSVDPVVRAQSYEVSAAYAVGGEIRYRFSDAHVAIGLSADYLNASLSRPLVTVHNESIPVNDGYTVMPVELTGYFIIPFSGKVFGVYMGAGGGMYFGERRLTVGNVASVSGSTSPGGGIHVLAGVSYSPMVRLTFLGEMKFRDVQFNATNTFPGTSIVYNGKTIAVTAQNDSRIYTDGVIFQLGMAFSF